MTHEVLWGSTMLCWDRACGGFGPVRPASETSRTYKQMNKHVAKKRFPRYFRPFLFIKELEQLLMHHSYPDGLRPGLRQGVQTQLLEEAPRHNDAEKKGKPVIFCDYQGENGVQVQEDVQASVLNITLKWKPKTRTAGIKHNNTVILIKSLSKLQCQEAHKEEDDVKGIEEVKRTSARQRLHRPWWFFHTNQTTSSPSYPNILRCDWNFIQELTGGWEPIWIAAFTPWNNAGCSDRSLPTTQ